MIVRVESAPLPEVAGVTAVALRVSCPAAIVAAAYEQSVKLEASMPSVTALPPAPHFVALAFVVET